MALSRPPDFFEITGVWGEPPKGNEKYILGNDELYLHHKGQRVLQNRQIESCSRLEFPARRMFNEMVLHSKGQD
jgi:hypothetical protein